jgi:26S proteasome regulatory subunit T1
MLPLRTRLCRKRFSCLTTHPRYVPVHLEYIITEILKNSFRATVEDHYKRNGSSANAGLPPVVITVSPGTLRQSTNPHFLSLRIRDQGGGVSRQNMRRIFSYAFTTAEATLPDNGGAEGGPYVAQYIGGSGAVVEKGGPNLFAEITQKGVQTGLGTFYGLGYGLPMSSLYARCDENPRNRLEFTPLPDVLVVHCSS